MKTKELKGIRLKVGEAHQEDVYKGIARIDSATMKLLGVRPGDPIKITGNRTTVAIADRAYPADVGEKIIRIDGIIRRNAKTGVGEIVIVEKAEVKEAKKIVLAPAQKGVTISINDTALEMLKSNLLGRAVLQGDLIALGGMRRKRDLMTAPIEEIFSMLGPAFGDFFPVTESIKFSVISVLPKQAVIITENTEIMVNPKAVEIAEKAFEVTYEDIGGLDEEIKKIREMVELPLKHPELFARLGIEPPKGILLYGPPGCGKTLLAKAVATESEANFILLNGPECMSKFYGESEKRIREIFEQAEKNAPTIIFIDEIDAIAPKREESFGEVERRVVSQLLTCMDGLKGRGKVIVIGATNMPNALDPALRRPGRFDRELAINVPNKKGRLAILKIHTRNMPLAKDVNLEEIATITHGFVGADLAALCKEAAMNVLRRTLPKLKLKEEEVPKETLEKLVVTKKDFREALKIIQPSAMREVLVETPNVRWNDIGGLEKAKQELKEAVELPLKRPDVFKRLGIEPPKGILLYGPPGCGKTLLAKAVATESEANFIQVKGPSLLSMWLGKSEEGIRKVFERAKQVSPCVIFFDEIDALATRRGLEVGTHAIERVLNQLLAEMDGIEKLHDIVVIGATNRPDMLDPALLRPGRFDRLIYIEPPKEKERESIFKIYTSKMPLAKDVNIKKLVELTKNYSGADIEAVCREAAIRALRENLEAKEVKMKHFQAALKEIRPSLSEDMIKGYEGFKKAYKITKQLQSYTG